MVVWIVNCCLWFYDNLAVGRGLAPAAISKPFIIFDFFVFGGSNPPPYGATASSAKQQFTILNKPDELVCVTRQA